MLSMGSCCPFYSSRIENSKFLSKEGNRCPNIMTPLYRLDIQTHIQSTHSLTHIQIHTHTLSHTHTDTHTHTHIKIHTLRIHFSARLNVNNYFSAFERRRQRQRQRCEFLITLFPNDNDDDQQSKVDTGSFLFRLCIPTLKVNCKQGNCTLSISHPISILPTFLEQLLRQISLC